MALTMHTLSGDVRHLPNVPVVDSILLRTLVLTVVSATPVIPDPGVGLRYGPEYPITVASDGSWTITLPDTDEAVTRYRLVACYLPHGQSEVVEWASAWFTLTGPATDADLPLSDASLPPTVVSQLRDDIAAVAALAYPDPQAPAKRLLRAVQDHMADPTSETRILVVGDSISDGVVTTSTPKHSSRWQGRLQAHLRTRFGHADASIGHIPTTTPTWTPRDVTYTGTYYENQTGFGFGAKGRAVRLAGTNAATATFPPSWCRRVRVWVASDAGVGAGRFKVLIDGTDRTTDGTPSAGVTLAGTPGNPDYGLTASGGFGGGYYWDSPLLSDGTHQVVVQSVLSGINVILTGVEYLAAPGAGTIKVLDGSHSGGTTAEWLVTGAGTHNSFDPAFAEVAAMAPHMILINLGSNDIKADGTGSPVTFKNETRDLVQRFHAAAPAAPIVLTKGWRRGGVSQIKWDAFQQAKEDIAAEFPGYVATWDLWAEWPQFADDGTGTQGLMFEATNPLHPSDAGQVRYAELADEFLGVRVHNLGGLVKSVDGITPDGAGNIDLALPLTGTGSPEGVVTAPRGSTWHDTTGTHGAWQWVKTTASGSTGWQVTHGDTGWRLVASASANVAGNLRVRRVNGTVMAQGDLTAGATVVSPETLATLPPGFRIAAQSRMLYGQNGQPPAKTLNVETGGAVKVLSVTASQSVQIPETHWGTTDPWPTSLPGTAA